MKTIDVHNDLITDPAGMPKLCPFGAIVESGGDVQITSGCRMCLLCVKKGPHGVFELQETVDNRELVDKSRWKGILVYVEQHGNHIHPVSLEMVGKAHELGAKCGQPVFAMVAGDALTLVTGELLTYGIDRILAYEDPAFADFRIEPYTAALEDAIGHLHPAVVLVGGTNNGRTLAPRTAARVHTGLTADCTVLDIQQQADLDQIRPAFGGNIMAHIRTPNHRPQFATVRYKIFDTACKSDKRGTVESRALPPEKLVSAIRVLSQIPKGAGIFIEDAQVIVAIGKGIGKESAIGLFERLAVALGGQIACTRPLVENGWMDPRKQIGLSGRTVKPKLIITCGVSGSVQFSAGMKSSDRIIAINTDTDAPIFKTAHIGIVGDIFDIVPALLERIASDSQRVVASAIASPMGRS